MLGGKALSFGTRQGFFIIREPSPEAASPCVTEPPEGGEEVTYFGFLTIFVQRSMGPTRPK